MGHFRGGAVATVKTKLKEDYNQHSERPRYFTKFATLTNFEILIVDWSVNFGAKSVRAYLIEIKGFSQRQYEHAIAQCSVAQWEARRREIINKMTEELLDDHTASIKELNESHILAAKLGLAKAMSFLISVTTASDLKMLVDAVTVCQRVARVALGLPMTEEGIENMRNAELGANTQRCSTAESEKHPWAGRMFTFEDSSFITWA